MLKRLFLLTGVGIGIGLMYYMDGERGPQRQQQLRTKVREVWDKAQDPERQEMVKHRAKTVLSKAQDKVQTAADTLSDKTSAMADEVDMRMHGRSSVDQELNRRTGSRLGEQSS